MRMLFFGTTAGLGAGILFDKCMVHTLKVEPSSHTLTNTVVAMVVLSLFAVACDRRLAAKSFNQ
jgi:hypothetical protein